MGLEGIEKCNVRENYSGPTRLQHIHNANFRCLQCLSLYAVKERFLDYICMNVNTYNFYNSLKELHRYSLRFRLSFPVSVYFTV